MWHVPRLGAVRVYPSPCGRKTRASRNSRVRTVVTLTPTQTSSRRHVCTSHRIRAAIARRVFQFDHEATNDEAPVGRCRPGPRLRSPEGQLLEPTLPLREESAAHITAACERFARARVRERRLKRCVRV